MLFASGLAAGRISEQQWQLLAVAYPPDKDVAVVLGGAEKTLTSRGVFQVKWQKDVARLDIAVENLPPAAKLGWPGQQYILWAIDHESKMLNLGPLPMRGESAKWQVQVPARTFGLLVTAEKSPKPQAPSSAVVLESLLPTDPELVVPVLRLKVPLLSTEG
ncbi:MAG: anti-sigma factor [Acidobacteria bacterium]|nr:anti-sigma factor [Acidobacteriota bacterium]